MPSGNSVASHSSGLSLLYSALARPLRLATGVAAALITFALAALVFAQDQVLPEDSGGDRPRNVKFRCEDTSFKTSDGVKIAARFYRPERLRMSKVPVVLLIHQVSGSMADYESFVPKLMDEGYSALAIDLRGHGGSIQFNDSVRTWEEFSDADYGLMINDVYAAVRYLETRPEVNIERIAIIGASIGANLALNYAVNDKRVRTLVLLSPSRNYHGVETLDAASRYGTRALLITACQDDVPSGSDSQALYSLMEKTALPQKMKLYSGALHGTQILNGGFGFDLIIIAWLGNNLTF